MNGHDIRAVHRWQSGADREDEDAIARETAVALSYNRRAHVVMMATPDDLEDFALGFSLSERIISAPEDLLDVKVLDRTGGLELAMTVDEAAATRLAAQRRNLTGRTGCGLCGAESLEQALRLPPSVGQAVRVSHQALQHALSTLRTLQPLQGITGAVHGAAWCDLRGRVLLAREDVGRHNALDKLIGALFRYGFEPSEGFVLVSSRASYEMVVKAATAGAELLLAVSAPTTLAIDLARQCGLTLVGFARPGRHNAYTHPERLTGEAAGND